MSSIYNVAQLSIIKIHTKLNVVLIYIISYKNLNNYTFISRIVQMVTKLIQKPVLLALK